jgi:DNA-binding XRE family transcriptional regulator
MDTQTIISPSGERLIVLTEADYQKLLAAAEDAADREAADTFRHKLASGDEELVPAEVVERILGGENRIRVWREHRGLTSKALAAKAGIAQGFVSQIETGKREGTVETLRKIASALAVTIDDLAG